jgi:hypothetical protein
MKITPLTGRGLNSNVSAYQGALFGSGIQIISFSAKVSLEMK